MFSVLTPMAGKTFGRLTVLHRYSKKDKLPVRWVTRCVCGEIRVVLGSHLRSGHTQSCGCIECREWPRATPTTHGMTHTPTYRAWAAMHRRCGNPNAVQYRWYGARGITVCARWSKFENFLADMGEKPAGLELKPRKKNNWGYSPRNCRWVTHQQNCQNRRSSRINK